MDKGIKGLKKTINKVRQDMNNEKEEGVDRKGWRDED